MTVRRLLAAAAMVLPNIAVAQADPSLSARREAVRAEHQAQEASCYRRFAVQACLDEVRARERDALRQIDAEADAAQREEARLRAAQRLATIEAKRAERDRRAQLPPASVPATPSPWAPQPGAPTYALPRLPDTASTPAARSPNDEEAQERARGRYAAKVERAQEHRRKAEERLARKRAQADRTRSRPLPSPVGP